MIKISASDVNKLRQMTGAGMMDCKKALEETNGDFEQAVDYLRKKGQKVATKRADRDAREGIVIAKTSDDKTFGVAIMLNSETDFVGKSKDFVDAAHEIASIALAKRPASLDELIAAENNGLKVETMVSELMGKTGEKTTLAHYEYISAACVSAYNHHGNRLATLVGLSKTSEALVELGHEISMQVAAMAPVAIDKDDVDQTIIDREIEIGKEQARAEGKAENMLEKIAIGKLNKFFKDNTLINQDFIKDAKLTVGQHMAAVDKEVKITGFKRLMLGE